MNIKHSPLFHMYERYECPNQQCPVLSFGVAFSVISTSSGFGKAACPGCRTERDIPGNVISIEQPIFSYVG